ncbi:restriction endonuclease subunit S [Streptomyces sp. NPDC058284]|uniref:restriction endonuclease subunit S n=1 Tax=unclassified Streptomyces TaxID=2593676 RepID=UPI00364EFE73
MSDEVWPTLPLGDVLAEPIRNGFSPAESEAWTGVQMLGLGCLSPDGFAPAQLKNAPSSVKATHSAALEDGDLLVSRANTRALVGLAGIYRDVGTPCIYPDLMMRLRPADEYLTEFLEIVLRWPRTRRSIMAMAQGTSESMVKISGETLRRLRVPRLPLGVQRRIVEVIGSVTALERGIEASIAKLRYLRQGLLDSAFRRDWPTASIGDLCRLGSGATPPRTAGAAYFTNKGTPWVKTLDLNEGLISSTDEALTSAAVGELGMRIYPVDAVLVAMYGGWEQIGRTAILKRPSAVNQAISVLIPDSELDPSYLLLALQHGRHRWRRVAASTRKDPNITKSDVRDFRIPVPPRGEQTRISELGAAPLREIALQEAEIVKLRKLKQGLVDDLLSGRVKVAMEA